MRHITLMFGFRDFGLSVREDVCLYVIAGNVFNEIDGGRGTSAPGITEQNADAVVRVGFVCSL